MTAPVRARWIWLVAHHGPDEEEHHCLRLPLGRQGIPVCARCLALYPILALVIVLDLTHRLVPPGTRWLVAFAAVAPAVIDWSRLRLFASRGRPAVRVITGTLAGLGLGLAVADHLRNPREPWVWALLATVAAIVALVLRVGRASA
jgi:uncharacterized membrane protein